MTSTLILLLLFFSGAQFGIALTASIIIHPILIKINTHSAIESFQNALS